ncbi:chemotaxis-specific protein-glutamate methyltransferase CheB [Isoptericola sp. b441]|uniref:Protein-glutamate methylesterase/protein-glutamine glutaminase n=1 Tax=Actinotalea lenta TaxID=3064654 RepID=A0ABT9D5M2_9CELL|nr:MULTISPECIES: chemotaxis-specific protein-glutamate methyltransferase CheB [unclassified Isoptericola]MDO8106097.1 chemotaxis-specific protein-glutamate methyltransferase CheB [Isoptericola sp. b441]MDO8122184.1 chemotaxis-specific protein-glutamate methyltransferase CheB [Isoptericola sp. b490]
MSRITVLVVDDSVVVRRLVTDALSSDPAIDVVGVAANGQIALSKVAQLKPDAVTMDIEMPVMTGIEAVRALRRDGHRMPIIMFSTLTERGAAATLDALAAGATDYVTKPANVGSVQESLARVADELIPRLKALVRKPGLPRAAAPRQSAVPVPHPAVQRAVRLRPAPARPSRPRAVVLGSSTGGPEALSTVLTGLNRPLPVPMLVVQHMPPVFTRQLAARLDRLGPNRVVEATEGMDLQPGWVYVAPGDQHLEVRRTASGARTHLQQDPPVNFCRPAVDVMFRSAVVVFGGDLLGVVLTGMGSDGRTGSQALVAAGGSVIVQDEPTSVVWGMPGAVATAGLAHAVLPITEIAQAVLRGVGLPDQQHVGGPR